eukprot:Gregarina_sp_Poly_1__10593@NODE_78_length_15809_cov_160_365646_g66_i0_p13_GENE_NODE_78_length_15809_cov_160_365646_g66_i0NODE_78_length_15809_cov_160_365646_g66_i0_p13_ORF_typecomplete_len103_score3_56CbiC/PF02570_15/0_14_NODE_78_length_15809_cov_160_365646_g66_i01069110999
MERDRNMALSLMYKLIHFRAYQEQEMLKDKEMFAKARKSRLPRSPASSRRMRPHHNLKDRLTICGNFECALARLMRESIQRSPRSPRLTTLMYLSADPREIY